MIHDLRPYPAMKDSGVPWLGQVPKHWEAHAIRRFAKVFAGATPSRAVPSYWDGGNIPWLASGDVNARFIRSAKQFITEDGFKNSSTKWIRPNSVVIALAGQGKTKGLCATVEFKSTCNQSLAVVEPNAEKVNHAFLAYYLESRYLDIRGLVGELRDGLNLEHVKGIPVPIPSTAEQLAIVRFLDHADRRIRKAIAAKQKLIKLLQEQKQVIIHQAVTRGLDPNVKLKPSGVEWLGDVPEGWKVKRLKHLIQGKLTYGANEAAEFTEREWPRYLRITDFSSNGTLKEDTFRSLPPDIARDYLLQGNDILLARSGATVGKAFLVPKSSESYCHAGYLIRARPDVSKVLPHYLFLYTQSRAFNLWKDSVFIQATIPNIGADKYADLLIPIPSLQEQAGILLHVQEATRRPDQAISRAQAEISLLREYRTRLIADVVTGKLDVRDAAARLPEPEAEALPEELEGDEGLEGEGDETGGEEDTEA